MCLLEIIKFLIVKCNSQIHKVKCYSHEGLFFFFFYRSGSKTEEGKMLLVNRMTNQNLMMLVPRARVRFVMTKVTIATRPKMATVTRESATPEVVRTNRKNQWFQQLCSKV